MKSQNGSPKSDYSNNPLFFDAVSRTGTVTRANWLDRKVALIILRICNSESLGIHLWDQTIIRLSEHTALKHTLIIHDRAALYLLMKNPLLNFGDLYSQKRIEVNGELLSAIENVYTGLYKASHKTYYSWINRTYSRISSQNNNLKKIVRSNIHHHYDIGNDFYKLWLDNAAMQYTCAYFENKEMTLEEAQIAKLDLICKKLRLQPGETVIEAGCGWGGLSRHMAKHYGVIVKAWNISAEQIQYCLEQAEAQQLSDRITYIEEDYRNIEGNCDIFVSVGMLEHVGTKHYKDLGHVIQRSLHKYGRGLLHTIGRTQPKAMNAWIEKRIFPGAYPPSLGEMMNIFEPYDMAVQDVENLRQHYAQTLRHWLNRFNESVDQGQIHYDETFIRAWRLYLTGSIAAFNIGEMQLYQVLFSRCRNNDFPWNRRFMVY